MERTEYPAMLGALTPSQAVDVLNDRVRQAGRLNTEIADWLAERRRLEEQYANGLRKLSRKTIDGLDLGVFSVPWTTLTNAIESEADSHASLASKIEVDAENPLRSFAGSNREMQAMTTMQGNLGAMAKEVDRAQQKIDKAHSKNDNKVSSANAELEHAQSQWDSQAPYVFENLQALDETRLNHLRDVLTQYNTHQVDQVEKNRVTAERCLNVLLNVETADEIKTFALRSVANKPRIERQTRSTEGSSLAPSNNIAATQSRSSLAPPIPHGPSADDASERANSVQDEDKKKGLKALRRFSTVIGRRKDRSSKAITNLEPMSETPEKKSRPSPFSALGRAGRKKSSTTLEPPSESSEQRPHSPMRLGSEILEPPRKIEEPSSPSPQQRRLSTANGVGSSASAAGAATNDVPSLPSLPNGGHLGDLSDIQIPRSSAAEPQKDAEGFSVPSREVDPITQAQQDATAFGDSASPQFNVNIRNAPIQEERGADADAALASVANQLQMQAPPPQRRVGTVRGRRDGRNSVFAPNLDLPTPPAEQPAIPAVSEAYAKLTGGSPGEGAVSAFDPKASTSSAQGAPLATLPIAPAQPAPSFSPPPETASSPFRPVSRAVAADLTGTDNQSIRSGRSLTSTGSQGLKHPELTETGLSSSILETVSARFENGRLTSSSLIGEVALAYHPPDFTTPFGTENIKLDNFPKLEKVAPNPAIIVPAPSGKEGEYTLNLNGISKTQIAFKYQARLDSTDAHAPLLLAPSLKLEPTQASIIVSYSLNPHFTLPTNQSSLTLSNVTIALSLEGARATTCQSRPVGTFVRDKNLIYWQLGEIHLERGAIPQKLLARFATDVEAKAGNVEAKWDVAGSQALSLGSALAVSALHHPTAADGSDPFADESAQGGKWKEVRGVKKLTAGAYSAR